MVLGGLVVLLALAVVFAVRGCQTPNGYVPGQAKQLTPAEREAIQSNPNLPPGIKGMMLHQGGPPHGNAARQ